MFSICNSPTAPRAGLSVWPEARNLLSCIMLFLYRRIIGTMVWTGWGWQALGKAYAVKSAVLCDVDMSMRSVSSGSTYHLLSLLCHTVDFPSSFPHSRMHHDIVINVAHNSCSFYFPCNPKPLQSMRFFEPILSNGRCSCSLVQTLSTTDEARLGTGPHCCVT
jgi:hypothetical protein